MACILLVVYGLRLSGYLLIREIRSAAYRNLLNPEIERSKKMSLGVKTALWLVCGLMYVLMTSPLFFRLKNGAPADIMLWMGLAVMVCGIILEAAADLTMGVDGIADRNVDELSGGQRQRVWIALALAQETDILFLDEPTTYLDIAYQIEILELLVQLNREKGITIVMVLHDINHAARYADWIFAMKDGTLVAQGQPRQILKEELIRQVYGMHCAIITDPVYGTPNIIPVGRAGMINGKLKEKN